MSILISFQLYSLSTIYIHDLKFLDINLKLKKRCIIFQNHFWVTQVKILEDRSSKTVTFPPWWEFSSFCLNVCRVQTQNKQMDWADENEDGNYFPIAELNVIEVMKIITLLGIMKSQFLKEIHGFFMRWFWIID